jgi:hypothetical protein
MGCHYSVVIGNRGGGGVSSSKGMQRTVEELFEGIKEHLTEAPAYWREKGCFGGRSHIQLPGMAQPEYIGIVAGR